MNLMTTGLSFLLVFPLLFKPERNQRDLFLGGFVLSQGLISLNLVLLYNENIGPRTHEIFTPFQFLPITLLNMAQGFLLFGFCLAMTNGTWRAHIKLCIAGALAFMYGMAEQIYVFSQPDNQKVFVMSYKFFVIGACYTGILAIMRMRQYKTKIYQEFSNVDNIQLRWLWLCVWGFTSIWIIDVVCLILWMVGLGSVANFFQLIANVPPLLMMSVMVIYSQTLYRDNSISRNSAQALPELSSDAQQQSKGKSYNPEHCQQIIDLMTRVKIYQDPELRLEGLADSLDLSPRSVSAILNGHFQKNFYDFVNEYRVRDAQDQLISVHNKKKSIQRVFEDAGFSSKTTFNTIFKKYTGKTPTEFRQSTQRVAL